MNSTIAGNWPNSGTSSARARQPLISPRIIQGCPSTCRKKLLNADYDFQTRQSRRDILSKESANGTNQTQTADRGDHSLQPLYPQRDQPPRLYGRRAAICSRRSDGGGAS